MCGRYVSSSTPDQLAGYFGAELVAEELDHRGANYNVAPTSEVFAVFEDGGTRRIDAFRWGLIPSWAKDEKIGSRLINARTETVFEKPSFRSAIKRRRCLIPADGFYEWRKNPDDTKTPMFIHRPDGEPYAFAGLWEVWTNPVTQKPVGSCTILTTAANTAMESVHNRMPSMIAPADWGAWLDRDLQDAETIGKFLIPAPPRLITMHPVSSDVNNVRNKGAHLIDPLPAD